MKTFPEKAPSLLLFRGEKYNMIRWPLLQAYSRFKKINGARFREFFIDRIFLQTNKNHATTQENLRKNLH